MRIEGGGSMTYKDGSYSALNIAKYVVTYFLDKKAPITHLKLQKLLYFLWRDFYSRTERFLFSEEFQAWQLGPVVPIVFSNFCTNGSFPILWGYPEAKTKLTDEDKQTVDDIISYYGQFKPYKLVDMTHEADTPWSKVYGNGEGIRSVISFDAIIEECSNVP